MKSKVVSVSVINDLYTDQRVHKVCMSLMKNGFEPILIGRRFKNSPRIERDYQTKRMRLLINKGVFFYAFFNLRLFLHLLRNTPDILLANDLDTLLANYLVHRIKGVRIVYDSHEFFTEVPELEGRDFAKSIWKRLEGWVLPKLSYAYTVSHKISAEYKKYYGLDMGVIYNFPNYVTIDLSKTDKSRNTIIYQGALNVSRGLEELINAMLYLEDVQLHIYGGGDIEKDLIQLVKELGLIKKVRFFGRVDAKELLRATHNAQVGVSIEKPIGLSYQYAVPNKIFDYLNAGISIYYSDLKEVKALLGDVEVGLELKEYSPEKIANDLKNMLSTDKKSIWFKNSKELSKKYNWELQERKLLSYFE